MLLRYEGVEVINPGVLMAQRRKHKDEDGN